MDGLSVCYWINEPVIWPQFGHSSFLWCFFGDAVDGEVCANTQDRAENGGRGLWAGVQLLPIGCFTHSSSVSPSPINALPQAAGPDNHRPL